MGSFEYHMDAARTFLRRGSYSGAAGTLRDLQRFEGRRLTPVQLMQATAMQGLIQSLEAESSIRIGRSPEDRIERSLAYYSEALDATKHEADASVEIGRMLTDYAIALLHVARITTASARAAILRDTAHAKALHAMEHFRAATSERHPEFLIANGLRGYALLEEQPAKARPILEATGRHLKRSGVREQNIRHANNHPLDWLYGCDGILRMPESKGEVACLAFHGEDLPRPFVISR